MFEKINADKLTTKREFTFLLLAGLFLGSLAMLNILGITRFIDLSKYIGIRETSSFRFSVAIGVLAYPITFLCTDLISELYGRKRANLVVWIGLLLNIWVLFILWLGGTLNPPKELLPDGTLPLLNSNEEISSPHGYAFYAIRKFAFGATLASMTAYLVAQFCDVYIFHYFKRKTKGKHLWLRNNASTMTSQLIDSILVILITHYFANALPINNSSSTFNQLIFFILSSYAFKLFFALLDTIPFYILVSYLRKTLQFEEEKFSD
jgi:uncharacterized PurR-regulated membrane protein YhhQ (DUF165 family)